MYGGTIDYMKFIKTYRRFYGKTYNCEIRDNGEGLTDELGIARLMTFKKINY